MRVLIVDDEAPARAKLRRMLGAHDDVEIVGEAADGFEALGLVAQLAPDVAFVDVQMPEADGFDLASSLPLDGPALVFVTAFDQHALRAFDVSAADYLLKPVQPERLAMSLQRLRRVLDRAPVGRPPSKAPARLLIVDKGQTTVVRCDEIEWLESADNYVHVHTQIRSFLMRRTLASLVSDLGPDFIRIHRTAAVSSTRVASVRPRGKGDATVLLHGGKELPCSRQHREGLLRLISAAAGAPCVVKPTVRPICPT